MWKDQYPLPVNLMEKKQKKKTKVEVEEMINYQSIP